MRSDIVQIATPEEKTFDDLDEIPLFFGIVFFVFPATYIVIPLENEMKTPKAFTKRFGVLNVAFTLVVLVYTAIGFFGYMKYSECLYPSIISNLPEHHA